MISSELVVIIITETKTTVTNEKKKIKKTFSKIYERKLNECTN